MAGIGDEGDKRYIRREYAETSKLDADTVQYEEQEDKE